MTKSLQILPLFILVGCISFSNILTNGFVWDDTIQIVNHPFIHSLSNIPLVFVTSIAFADTHFSIFSYYYKPLFFLSYILLYFLGGGKPLLFHIVQILLHSINAYLVWILFKKYFSKKASLLLAIFFLVHPINEETVAYIANLQEVLFFFFGMCALLVLRLANRLTYILLAGILFLCACMSKETGVLFVGMGFIFLAIYKTTCKRVKVLTLLGTLFLYSIFRLFGSLYYFLQVTHASHIPILSRIHSIPFLVTFYLKEAILPSYLVTYPLKVLVIPSIVQQEFVITTILLFFISSCVIIFYKYIRNNNPAQMNTFIFFLCWFLTGIIIHLQIFPLEQFVAKRWFYFPLVGLLGMFGIASTFVTRKTVQIACVILTIIILCYFIFQTRTMNAYWGNIKILKQHSLSY